jgi:hypothetical protein
VLFIALDSSIFNNKNVAKLCFQWFQTDTPADYHSNITLKYQAELSLAKKDFLVARSLYDEILRTASRSNSSLFRDASEGMVRSCLRTDQMDEALKWARLLVCWSFRLM